MEKMVDRLARSAGARHPAIPVGLAVAVAVAATIALLAWSVVRADKASLERQGELVGRIVEEQLPALVSHIDLSTASDQSLSATHRRRLDWKYIDNVWGPAHSAGYHGWDELYLLDQNGRPYYSMREGSRPGAARFERLAKQIKPLIEELRATMRAAKPAIRPGSISPEAADIMRVDGQLALVSIKPIVDDTGSAPRQSNAHLNIVVDKLDAAYSRRIGKAHHLQDARISPVDDRGSGEASCPYVSPRSGKAVGYLIWTPYRPGAAVLRSLTAPLVAALTLFAIVVFVLVRRLCRNTAELEASEAQARHLAFHDVLTGLPNRALFEDRLERALAAVRRDPKQQMALLCLDLDRFKQVNDTLGHPAGDELVRQLARRLSALVRDNDTVARLGGDEFAIIQTGVSARHEIEGLCERIIAAVEEPFDLVSSQAFVGMSIGVARSADAALDRTELARKADIALYQAKCSGRGRFVLFADPMDEGVQARRVLEEELRTALRQGNQLEVYYQPLYEAANRALVGVEALVRWHHPRRGLIGPPIFIPVAEETGLIEPLGEWVLKEACSAAVPWPVGTVSVNVAAIQVRNPLFAQRVLQILLETGLAARRLELEITETSFLENVEQCQANLKLLRFAGVRIALDDFGTGYSSFNNLRNHQVDRLKIDQSFTNAIDGSDEGSTIIRAIVALARSTGLKVTAEGIETIEQSDFLRSVGCDELQGFLMSRPMPLAQMDQMLGVERAARRTLDVQPEAAA